MAVSETNPTPEQIAAGERAMDGLEAQADIWAEEVRLVDQVKAMGDVSRGLTDRMPADVRNGFINRQEAQIDAIARQAYLEGFYRGGESRKAYDEARLTAALSDQVVAPKAVTISDTAENIARSFAQYCLEHDILTMHGMKGLRERVELIISGFKNRIDDLENTIDLADKHTAFLMTKIESDAPLPASPGKGVE